jgi:hypothetical protein
MLVRDEGLSLWVDDGGLVAVAARQLRELVVLNVGHGGEEVQGCKTSRAERLSVIFLRRPTGGGASLIAARRRQLGAPFSCLLPRTIPPVSSTFTSHIPFATMTAVTTNDGPILVAPRPVRVASMPHTPAPWLPVVVAPVARKLSSGTIDALERLTLDMDAGDTHMDQPHFSPARRARDLSPAR